jgi:hypothetical protein
MEVDIKTPKTKGKEFILTGMGGNVNLVMLESTEGGGQ